MKFFRDIVSSYKNGNSVERLSIMSNIATITTFAVAIITGQAFAIKFLINPRTIVAVVVYVVLLLVTLLLLFMYLGSLVEAKGIKNKILWGIALFIFVIPSLYSVWYFLLNYDWSISLKENLQ